MKKIFMIKARILAAVLSLTLLFTSAACGQKSKIVNVGVTNAINTLNPLLLDGTEVGKYASGLSFLPLVELNKNNEFDSMLAKSITTEDQMNFTIKLEDEAKWSDGKAITADDVIYTIVKLTSDKIANPSMSTWAAIAGLDDAGTHKDADKEISGVTKIDEKTLRIKTKEVMPLNTFQNTYARYLLTIPKHVLEAKSTEELKTTDWFNKPDVVSGPYMATEVNPAHFVTYVANGKYFKGAAKIGKLNIKIVDGAQLLTGLQSGEIDFVQQTMATFPQEDLETISGLNHVSINYDKPMTNQLIFINTKTVPDVKVRQAMLMAIDREMLLKNFLQGNGEIVDGFLTSAGPLYDSSVKALPFDPEKAKALVKEAGWDQTKELIFKVNTGDSTFMQAVNIVISQLAAVGIKAKAQGVDINNLLEDAIKHDFDMMAVQYTLAPVDPFPDVAWLMTGDNWANYKSEAMDKLVGQIQTSKDMNAMRAVYKQIDELVQKDVPMINAYVISAPGIVNNRLLHAEASTYGFFNNIQDWEIK